MKLFSIVRVITLSFFLAGQLVKLDSLALYWNTKDDIGKLPSQEDWVVITLVLLLIVQSSWPYTVSLITAAGLLFPRKYLVGTLTQKMASCRGKNNEIHNPHSNLWL